MKALFITTNDIKESFGGAIGSKRNFELLCKYFGQDNVDYILLNENPNNTFFEKIKKNIDKFLTCSQFETTTLKRVDFSKYALVFNDNSVTGRINKSLRKLGYAGKIVTYFHNCEFELYYQLYDDKPWMIKNNLFRIVKANEAAALRYSDACMILNERDLRDIVKHYDVKFDYKIIPVSIKDTFVENSYDETSHAKPIFTFIGSYFGPNVNGILWFIKNVMPHVNIKLRIIGRNMNKLSSQIADDNIEILSDVPDLERYIRESDCMVYPIFEGSGMKLKTCEALMYGKNIIGTTEAFMGYDIKNFDDIGACCNTSDEFITAISNFSLPRYNSKARKIYLDKYSYEATYNQFSNLMKQIGL